MADKKECMACIGFDGEHTCEGYAQLQDVLKHKDKCYRCAKLTAQLEAVKLTIKEIDEDIRLGKADSGRGELTVNYYLERFKVAIGETTIPSRLHDQPPQSAE